MNSSNDQTFVNSSFKITIPPAARKALVEFWGNDEIIDQPEIIADHPGRGGVRSTIIIF